MDDIYFGEEDAKYVKPKQKKKAKKSKHKHIYDAYCVAIAPNRHFLNKALVKYCSECGKVEDVFLFPNPDTVKRLEKEGRYFKIENEESLCLIEYIPIVKD